MSRAAIARDRVLNRLLVSTAGTGTKTQTSHITFLEMTAERKMSPDLYFALTLVVKMAVTAAFLLAATITAERAGPLIGGLVATLPISAGPVYIFLALDHDAHFIAQSALGSLVTNANNMIFAVVYALLAQNRSLAVSFGVAIGVWTGTCWHAVRTVRGRSPRRSSSTSSLSLLRSGCRCHCVMHRCRAFERRWYDLALRATMVALLVGVVVTLQFPHRPDGERQPRGLSHRAQQHHVHPAPSRRRAGDGGQSWRMR